MYACLSCNLQAECEIDQRSTRPRGRVDGDGADALLVVRQRYGALARREVPEPHAFVHRAADELRLGPAVRLYTILHVLVVYVWRQ